MTTLDPGRKSWNFAHDSKPGTCTPVCHQPHRSQALWFSLLVTWGWCNQYGSRFWFGVQLSDPMCIQGQRHGAFDLERYLTLVFREVSSITVKVLPYKRVTCIVWGNLQKLFYLILTVALRARYSVRNLRKVNNSALHRWWAVSIISRQEFKLDLFDSWAHVLSLMLLGLPSYYYEKWYWL